MGSSPQRFGQSKPKKVRLLYARKVSLFSFLVALPGVIVSGIFILQASWAVQSKIGLFVLILIAWGLLALTLAGKRYAPTANVSQCGRCVA